LEPYIAVLVAGVGRAALPWSGPPGWWIAALIFIVVAGVVSFVVRASILKQGGLNPFAAREQLEAKLAPGT
jgi:hypothetical protein